jgi:hypothetical protein
MSKKNPLTPAGIEPATFRFVAQHLPPNSTKKLQTARTEKYVKGKDEMESELR